MQKELEWVPGAEYKHQAYFARKLIYAILGNLDRNEEGRTYDLGLWMCHMHLLMAT
jgi:hypothetical protein